MAHTSDAVRALGRSRITAGPNGCATDEVTDINVAAGPQTGGAVGFVEIKSDVLAVRCDLRSLRTCGVGGSGDAGQGGCAGPQVAHKDVRNAVVIARYQVVGRADEGDEAAVGRHNRAAGVTVSRRSIRSGTGQD